MENKPAGCNKLRERSFIPLKKHGNAVLLAEGDESNNIINDFKIRSEEIKQEKFIETEYDKYTKAVRKNYLSKLGIIDTGNIFLRILKKLYAPEYQKLEVDFELLHPQPVMSYC